MNKVNLVAFQNNEIQTTRMFSLRRRVHSTLLNYILIHFKTSRNLNGEIFGSQCDHDFHQGDHSLSWHMADSETKPFGIQKFQLFN